MPHRGQIMDLVHRALRRCGLALLCGLVVAGSAAAQRIGEISKAVDNLMVVLREQQGPNKLDETLQPVGQLYAQSGGEDIRMDLAWYRYLGDMQIRFVFDGPKSFQNATAEEFARFHLSPAEAVERAMANIKRVYGEPHTQPWSGGLTLVVSRSPDLDSSYFLDRTFWREKLTQHPEGLVVGVPKRGGLVFTPLSDTAAVAQFRRGIGYLYQSSEKLRISSALYLFKDDRWTVFQPPVGQ
jgi:hypothetical protein